MEDKKYKILCLHGWRTSGKILFMQTAAMQYHTPLHFEFIDAPHSASGPPVEGISLYYPNQPYYEWHLRPTESDDISIAVNESIRLVISKMQKDGPYDGILGFSQGGGMVTRLCQLQQTVNSSYGEIPHFKFAIIIGGVPPIDIDQTSNIDIPSLHIIGTSDPLRPRCLHSLEYYKATSRTLLEHSEGHNIPSLNTGLYPKISSWIHNLQLD